MIEEIFPDLYRIEIPLPNNPLKSLNSYLIKTPERSLIIDTGMNREECAHEMFSCLETMSVDLSKTDFFITHLHADHSGLVVQLVSDTSTVYFNAVEVSIVNPDRREKRWQGIRGIFRSHGFPEDELERAMAAHPGQLYGMRRHIDFHVVREGDIVNIGDYSFQCIETPGHTPGHICLYDKKKKLLVSGDHILFDITPNITFWPELENSLKMYLASLEKVYDLDVNLVLPGHRSIWSNQKERISELKAHHQARLDEVVFALDGGGKTSFEIAPYITWDIDCSSWELFPPSQKFFAVGETIAHVEYLEKSGVVCREKIEGKILFSLT